MGQARDGNGSYQTGAIALLAATLASPGCSLRQLSIGGCKVQDDEAHDLGKGLCHNTTLERLVVDRTALAVQTLSSGERLALAGVDFSEVDATVMAQLLLHNTRLTSVDVSGTRALPRELKILSDAFARCRFPLREISVAGRCLGLEAAAALLDALAECPLEALDLTGNEVCGIKESGTEPLASYVLRLVCELVRRPGGKGLRRLKLKGNHLLGNDVYTSEGVSIVVAALTDPNCRLEELHLGLTNKGSGLRDEDGLALGVTQACRTLTKLQQDARRAADERARRLDAARPRGQGARPGGGVDRGADPSIDTTPPHSSSPTTRWAATASSRSPTRSPTRARRCARC